MAIMSNDFRLTRDDLSLLWRGNALMARSTIFARVEVGFTTVANTKRMFLPAHSRAGRALLEWTQETLAKKAGVSLSALRAFERGRSNTYASNLNAIESALRAAGIELIDEPGLIGVKLREKPAKVRKS
jgi:DNA-binding XRE family transcriptional regulator